ncbi:MAG: hypothetical protein B6I25_07225 [Planctomycetales bacterium 4572_13]|nr:MAG: hypothetical protein B6I25_07225 [Planctomycetales bacterium 4572_13]
MVSGQCEYGNYHINDTNLIIEIVDRDNNPVQKGWMGRILLTDLTNYSMPFIRYDIGDLGQLKAGTCECGRGLSLMKQPKGRDTDIIYLSNGNYLIVHFFTALFEFYSEVKQFQVIETDFDKLQLNLVVTEDFNCQLLKEIKFKITESAGMHIDIWENIVDEIPATSSGKRRFVIAKKRNG